MSRRSKRWSQRKRSVRRPVEAHADPGSIRVDPHAAQPRITVIAFGPTTYREVTVDRVADVAAWRGQAPILWINVDGLGNGSVIAELGAMFGLHPLALEDVVNTHQRAKVDEYGDTLFCTARMVYGPPLESEQISMFVGPDYLLTFQEDRDGDSLDPVRQRLRQGRGRVRHLGADYLLYELFDAIIESYFPVLEKYGVLLDGLDEEGDYRECGRKLAQNHQLRGDFLYLRRMIWPYRDALQSMLRGGHRLIQPETQLYLRDCLDHVAQLIDILEIYRESCSDLRDFLYTRISNRTNEIMRMLAIISTVFLPMTFVAGVYGMNFDDMPELHWGWGYPLALAIMGVIACAFLVFFQRRGWLTSGEQLEALPSHTQNLSPGETSHLTDQDRTEI